MRSPDRDPWPAVRGRVAPGSAQRLRPTPTQHSRLSSDTLVPRTRTPAKTAAFLSRGMIHVHNQMCQNHAPVDFYWFDVKRQLHGCPMDTVHHRQLAVGDPNDPQHSIPSRGFMVRTQPPIKGHHHNTWVRLYAFEHRCTCSRGILETCR